MTRYFDHTTTKKQIRTEYLKLSLLYHPDKPQGSGALFKEILNQKEQAMARVAFFVNMPVPTPAPKPPQGPFYRRRSYINGRTGAKRTPSYECISSDSDDHTNEESQRIFKEFQRRDEQYANEPAGSYEQHVEDTANVDPFEDIKKKRKASELRKGEATGKHTLKLTTQPNQPPPTPIITTYR